MTFHSLEYFIFFPVIFFFFYLSPRRFRGALLLLSSCIFYAAFSIPYLGVILIVIAVNYIIGIRIVRTDGITNKYLYKTGILFNIAILAFFKYFGFLAEGGRKLAVFLHLHYPEHIVRIILPAGFSFIVLTAIAYLIDVRQEKSSVQRRADVLASFFLFFPKMMQGPIERAGRLIPQFISGHEFRYADATEGLKMIGWGLFKKVVVADRLAGFVNAAYADPAPQGGLVWIVTLCFFSLQIYADFSGYTDIALGSARMLGFELTQNFQRPYLSTTIREFWSRWHISLSSWLRDYLFLPLSYSLSRTLKSDDYFKIQTDKWIYIFATFVTFAFAGLWHGAGWAFLIWGLLFAFYLSVSLLTRKIRKNIIKRTGLTRFPRLLKGIRILATFSLVSAAWIFFRAVSLPQAIGIIRNFTHGWSLTTIRGIQEPLSRYGMSFKWLYVILPAVSVLFYAEIVSVKKDFLLRIKEKPLLVRWAIYYLLIIAILFFSASDSQQFIYFQF